MMNQNDLSYAEVFFMQNSQCNIKNSEPTDIKNYDFNSQYFLEEAKLKLEPKNTRNFVHIDFRSIQKQPTLTQLAAIRN